MALVFLFFKSISYPRFGLSNILQAELRQNEQIRQCERLEAEALRDGLTGLYNRRAWERLISREEERCKRYGHPTAVFLSI